MNVFQVNVFELEIFQHEVIAEVEQTLPALSQSAIGEVCKPLFQRTVYQRDVFGGCEEIAPSTSGAIEQTLPALGQSLHGTSGAEVPPTQAFLVPVTPKRIRAEIHQTLPALVQSLEAHVTDDELVLLMI